MKNNISSITCRMSSRSHLISSRPEEWGKPGEQTSLFLKIERVSEQTHVIASVRETQRIQTHRVVTAGFLICLATQHSAITIKQIASKAMTSVVKAMTGVGKAMTGVAKAMTSVVEAMTGVGKTMTGVAKAMTSVVEATTGVAKAMTSVAKALTSVAKAMISVGKAITSLPKASNLFPTTNRLHKTNTESISITWSIVVL